MLVRYRFVNDEVSEIEVSQEVGEAIKAMEQEQAIRERAETRNHVLLSALNVEGAWFAERESVSLDDQPQNVLKALRHMPPKQRELIWMLYLREKPLSRAELASRWNTSEEAIKQRVKRARQLFVKLLQKADT